MLNKPPLYANNAGAYAIASTPPDTDSKYAGTGILPNQPVIHTKWYEVFDIGVESRTGSNQASYSSPLTAGSVQRIKTDATPDYWLVSIVVNAATAQLNIWTDGDPVGPPVRIGNGGMCIIPSRGKPFLTVRAQNVNIAGTVIAFSGYAASDILMNGGNQP